MVPKFPEQVHSQRQKADQRLPRAGRDGEMRRVVAKECGGILYGTKLTSKIDYSDG